MTLLHSIGKMSPAGKSGPWIRRYIFPGGYAPALAKLFPAVKRNRLGVTDVEILRLRDATTLHQWCQRFEADREQVKALHDETFCRMWGVYLICGQMVFRSGSQQVFHMQIGKRRDAVPLTRRDTMAREARLPALF